MEPATPDCFASRWEKKALEKERRESSILTAAFSEVSFRSFKERL